MTLTLVLNPYAIPFLFKFLHFTLLIEKWSHPGDSQAGPEQVGPQEPLENKRLNYWCILYLVWKKGF